VPDLSNVVAASDLSSEYFCASLTADANLVSEVLSAGNVVAAVAWPQKKAPDHRCSRHGGHAANLVAALEDPWPLGFAKVLL